MTGKKPSESAPARAAADAAPASASAAKSDAAAADAKPESPRIRAMKAIQRIVALLDKSAEDRDARLVLRALRLNTVVRKHASAEVLREALEHYVPETSALRAPLMDNLRTIAAAEAARGREMEVDSEGVAHASAADAAVAPAAAAAEEAAPWAAEPPRTSAHPEVEVYFHLLAVAGLLQHREIEQALASATAMFQRTQQHNRRTMDPLSSRVYHYFGRANELAGRLSDIRGALLGAHRTACLRHNEIGQATLLNLLLRSYLRDNLYDQAQKLVAKTSFPEDASNSQLVRFLYYHARVLSVQLEYSDAYARVMQAVRKAPQHTARGFRVAAQKLAVIVQLLMGEIPERTLFNQPDMRVPLLPFLHLTLAVRVGDLKAFERVEAQFADLFRRDNLLSLVHRLRHNVIKAGLRKLSVSYSRLSFQDVADKLHLGSAEDAEFVCAKAIRDGVIDAVLDPRARCMRSKTVANVYTTTEPLEAFHRRIAFCLDVHNEAVKAMRFPAVVRRELETAEEAAKREAETAEALEDFDMDEDEEDDME